MTEHDVEIDVGRTREERFMSMLEPHHAHAERYALSLLRNRDDAKDLLQDAIVIIWQKLDDLRDPAAFRAYFFVIITNLARRRFRRQNIFQPLAEDADDTLPYQGRDPETSAEVSVILDAIHRLPQRSREAILLYEVEDLSVKEIAKIQRSTVSAVKVRLFRARKHLMKILNITEDDATNVDTSASLMQ
jgi:RNA polymerase sigma-70 factor, ECF subfamily